MEDRKHILQHHAGRDAPHVLLAGFAPDYAEQVTVALGKMGWTSNAFTDESKIERAFVEKRFDVTLIDVEKLEVFAPQCISRLRQTSGRSCDAPIIAVDASLLPALKERLLWAGADLVVPKPADPTLYIMHFAKAASLRLQRGMDARG